VRIAGSRRAGASLTSGLCTQLVPSPDELRERRMSVASGRVAVRVHRKHEPVLTCLLQFVDCCVNADAGYGGMAIPACWGILDNDNAALQSPDTRLCLHGNSIHTAAFVHLPCHHTGLCRQSKPVSFLGWSTRPDTSPSKATRGRGAHAEPPFP
jgi:hypothetical protein